MLQLVSLQSAHCSHETERAERQIFWDTSPALGVPLFTFAGTVVKCPPRNHFAGEVRTGGGLRPVGFFLSDSVTRFDQDQILRGAESK